MNITDLITEGLELGGNPGLTTRATAFLKILLRHLYRNYDWNFLLTPVTVAADAATYHRVLTAMPPDYRAIKQVTVEGGDGTPLIQLPYEQVLAKIASDVANGVSASKTKPLYFATQEIGGSRALLFYPIPDTRYNYELLYYKMPDTASYTGATFPEFDDEAAMVTAIAHFVQQWDKETLQALIAREASAMAASYRNNHEDRGRARVQQLPFEDAVFRNGPRD